MISIIVPIYNAELYLRECIDSILNQSFTDIEVILVDDGSTDRSLKICRSYSDPRIIIVSKTNGGVSSARNAGINAATGEYLGFVDSDDTLPEDALLLLHRTIKSRNVDAVFGSFQYQYGKKFQVHKSRLKEGVYKCKDLLCNFLDDGTLSGFLLGSMCGGLYRKDVIRKYVLKVVEGLKNNEDGK